jgi:CRISPR-associated protein (TIGR02584 family)
MHLEQYPRRILLCVSGLSPQIVTETLYALAVTGEPRFVPTEIHLLTTADGAERARLTLLSEEPRWFQRLRQDYGLPDIHFNVSSVYYSWKVKSLSSIRSVKAVVSSRPSVHALSRGRANSPIKLLGALAKRLSHTFLD